MSRTPFVSFTDEKLDAYFENPSLLNAVFMPKIGDLVGVCRVMDTSPDLLTEIQTHDRTDYLVGIKASDFVGMTHTDAEKHLRSYPNGTKVDIRIYNDGVDNGYNKEIFMENTIRFLVNPKTKVVIEASLG